MSSHADAVRRLVLLRHAKAEQADKPDSLRALTSVGRRQSTWVGQTLLASGVVPELALVSSSVRTRETWQLVAAAFEPEPEADYRDELYGAGVGSLAAAVAGVDDRVRTLVVVGHEPTTSAASRWLAGSDSDPGALDRIDYGIPTGSYTVLEVAGAWSELGQGRARLADVVVSPKER